MEFKGRWGRGGIGGRGDKKVANDFKRPSNTCAGWPPSKTE